MNRFSFLILTLGFIVFPLFANGQMNSNYQILKTNNAYVVKPQSKDFTRIDTEGMSLDCSTTNLSSELNFGHISSYFDEETQILFRNMKIQARVYVDIQGNIRDLYFICENDPKDQGIDFAELAMTIQRKYKIAQNDECLPKLEDKFISWYIPLYQY
ncbi:hypothetical protein [uncultured Cyclobacterium sp.]|uniref:hypothetical protein n=1 Tax=uncultured Cyclobacterium sp. TaxID=453820 RepID=UPI0030EE2588|tara:strand:+ start:134739 stop:135209 length:471 start_codon:yes stop_codon:yes gene_type:complete